MSRLMTSGRAVSAAVAIAVVAGCGGPSHNRQADPAPPPTSAAGTSAPSSSPGATSSAVAPQSPAAFARSSMQGLPVPTDAELAAARSVPVEDPYYPNTSNPEVDALHYALGLDWDGSTLFGDTTVVFRVARATGQVRLDLSDALVADSVSLDGRGISFRQPGDDGLVMSTGTLQQGSVHTLEIAYSGSPQSTPAPSKRSDMAEGLGWNTDSDGSVYTFQEPYGAFTWYPVNDHPSDKALYDAAITTTGGVRAVFNGTLSSSVTSGDHTTNTWHLDAPAASYLTTLAIGPYTRTVSTTPSGMAIAYWLEPRDAHLLPDLEREGSASFEWLQSHAGSYPFSTLGVVVVGGASAMETETMITMSRSAVNRSDAVLEHEMAHQWYGDSLTPRDWQGLWLSEGWAMYMQQWYERDSHRPVYAGGISHWRSYDQASRNRSGPPGDYRPSTFADVNVYLGPAMMLDAIRQRIGDAAFADLAKAWPAEHEDSSVSRALFARWLRQDTGVDFTGLMHRWLDSAHTPPAP